MSQGFSCIQQDVYYADHDICKIEAPLANMGGNKLGYRALSKVDMEVSWRFDENRHSRFFLKETLKILSINLKSESCPDDIRKQ